MHTHKTVLINSRSSLMMMLFIIFIIILLATPFGINAENCDAKQPVSGQVQGKCKPVCETSKDTQVEPVTQCPSGTNCCVPVPTPASQETVSADLSVPTFNFPDPLGGADVPTIVYRLINSVLLLSGALFFVMFLWGGITWMISEGDKSKVEKSTKTLRNAVIGLAIIATSYVLVTNIINLLSR